MVVPAPRLEPVGTAPPDTRRPRPTPVPDGRRRRARERRLPFLLFLVAIVTGLVVGLVSAQTLVAQGSFRLQELTQRANHLDREFSRLRVRAGQLSSLDRIERAGKAAGLVYNDGYHVLTVPSRHSEDQGSAVAPGVEGAADVKAAMGATP
jgi:cell division protein FtsL